MDQNNSPTFEIPKNSEKEPFSNGPLGGDMLPVPVEGTHEVLQSPLATSQPASFQVPPPGGSGSPAPTDVVSLQPVQNYIQPVDDAHLIAEDADVMEKEWVERAKKVLSQTSQDPYIETKEVGKLKASYMRKRFNKELKLSEDKAA
jgi:hypothetical protein